MLFGSDRVLSVGNSLRTFKDIQFLVVCNDLVVDVQEDSVRMTYRCK